jgi:hypothetical protein
VLYELEVTTRGSSVLRAGLEPFCALEHQGRMTDLHVS